MKPSEFLGNVRLEGKREELDKRFIDRKRVEDAIKTIPRKVIQRIEKELEK